MFRFVLSAFALIAFTASALADGTQAPPPPAEPPPSPPVHTLTKSELQEMIVAAVDSAVTRASASAPAPSPQAQAATLPAPQSVIAYATAVPQTVNVLHGPGPIRQRLAAWHQARAAALLTPRRLQSLTLSPTVAYTAVPVPAAPAAAVTMPTPQAAPALPAKSMPATPHK